MWCPLQIETMLKAGIAGAHLAAHSLQLALTGGYAHLPEGKKEVRAEKVLAIDIALQALCGCTGI